MSKILVADGLSDAGIDILKNAGLEVELNSGLSENELVDIASQYEGIIIRSATTITSRIIEAATNLRIIGRGGVGVDNIDIDAATSRGVIVMNTPFGNITSAAEHALALMMSLSRNVTRADLSMKSGKWNKKAFIGTELAGKTLGIVGFGKIGSIVARVAKALGMDVLAIDPFLSEKRANEMGVKLVELKDALPIIDYLTLHVPLTDSTKNIISTDEFKAMKPTARLINCARGGVVDEAALKVAIEEKEIAGAAFDVYATEPLPEDSPLRSVEGIILTPHLGASTADAQERVSQHIAEQFVSYFKDDKIENAINISLTISPALLGFAQLAEKLGAFAAQCNKGSVDTIEVTAAGAEVAESEAVKIIGISALRGALCSVVEERVNMVNVVQIAEERGIELIEHSTSTPRTYRNRIDIKLRSGENEFTVSGALFDGTSERIVAINGCDLDVSLSSQMIVTTYEDKPGMVGHVGTILAEADVNIAGMAVGRSEAHGKAVMLLTLDNPVSPEVIEKLCSAINAESTSAVKL